MEMTYKQNNLTEGELAEILKSEWIWVDGMPLTKIGIHYKRNKLDSFMLVVLNLQRNKKIKTKLLFSKV